MEWGDGRAGSCHTPRRVTLAVTVVWLASLGALPADAPAQQADAAQTQALEREALRSSAPVEATGESLREDVPESLRPGARLVEGPVVTDDQRVRRFVGALLGGFAGAAAAMPLFLFEDATCPPTACGPSSLQYLGVAALPLLAALGSLGGFEAMGGDGAPLAPLVAVVPAALVTAPLLALAASLGVTSAAALLPFLLPGVAVQVFTAAWLLSSREEALGPPGALRRDKTAPGARVAASIGAGLAVAVLGTLLSWGLAGLCDGTGYCGALVIGLGVATLAGVAGAQWATHRRMGGRGKGWVILLGLAGVGLVALSMAPLSTTGGVFPPLAGGVMGMVAAEAMLLSLLVLPAAFLEWSHARVTGEALGAKLSFGAAPLPGGGVLSAGLSF